jgi:hypothetical protein
VTLLRVLIGVVVVIAAFVVVFGPSTYVVITGHPMSVECWGPEPACDEVVGEMLSGTSEPGLFGPVTWIEIHLVSGICGPKTVGHWWPFYDPFAITGMPLCN